MSHGRRISVIGLGYVGLPVAVAFGKIGPVIGFDINPKRIKELKSGHDRTMEVPVAELKTTDVKFSSEVSALKAADFHIIAVPTPIDDAKQPDLRPLLSASKAVGHALKKGDVVVFESTVYPGATEEECVPVLEKTSGLKAGTDFRVGYSPERINPGDTQHSFAQITKVVSGQDTETLDIVAKVYGAVVSAGVHRAPSIKVAEAAKVIENTQRDLNIALMNELALIFERMGIDTLDVLEAAATKWNFLRFSPGLVGGHCIGVDPYYLTHKATMLDYYPQVILAGRRINDSMSSFITSRIVKNLIRRGRAVKGSRVTVLGLSFKEDVPDVRNTRVIGIIRELEDYEICVQVHDPLVDAAEAKSELNVELAPDGALKPADCVVLAVAHKSYREKGWQGISALLNSDGGVVVDVKGVLPRDSVPPGVQLCRL
ncbi:MAG: nucleotide sugar dehydrogenase [Gammaproteobacteria bacterium]|nr:nucleotide sugar dehydrogenase [Gammaproteobacteria bacterium]MDH3411596.1 nucleotide sugar dehydrogenase [Gammaproteobacteria bacterium]